MALPRSVAPGVTVVATLPSATAPAFPGVP